MWQIQKMKKWPRRHTQNRRTHDRKRVLLRGRIILPVSEMSVYVTIINRTDCGAMVQQKFACRLPKGFDLEVQDPIQLLPIRHACSLRWQKGNLLGVEFSTCTHHWQDSIADVHCPPISISETEIIRPDFHTGLPTHPTSLPHTY